MFLFDIDNFTCYNDMYRLPKGDKILAKLGEVILSCLRKTGCSRSEQSAAGLRGEGVSKPSKPRLHQGLVCWPLRQRGVAATPNTLYGFMKRTISGRFFKFI